MGGEKMGKEKILNERIDKNGTRHQIVETVCNRCGGAGGSEKWRHTGYTCFKCGGSGRMKIKRKIYTPEYAKKLEERREKRRQKKIAEIKAKAEEENKIKLKEWGYDGEKIFLVIGDTYAIKDELKKAGAKFNYQVRGWFFTEKPSQWKTVELKTDKLVWYNDFGQVHKKQYIDIIDYINEEKSKVEYQSQFVGNVGDKIELELTVISSFWLEPSEFYYANQYINKLKDEKGNVFIWKTNKNLKEFADEDGKIILKGTIKEHKTYGNEKQTILTRCKIVEGGRQNEN